MKIAITGSRSIKDEAVVYFSLQNVIVSLRLHPTSVTTGGAVGVDSHAEKFFSEFYGITADVIRPKYSEYPPNMRWKAPLDRNEDVVKDADVVIAVWDGEGVEGKGGTWDAIRKAKAHDKRVVLVNVKERIIRPHYNKGIL